MNANPTSFIRRARLFFAELKQHRFPNASTIQRLDGCSRATAARVIERLQSEFGFPIRFDPSTRGYELTNRDFSFEFLPPGKDELCAAFLALQLADCIGSTELADHLQSFWGSVTAGRGVLSCDLARLPHIFSADLTAVSQLADAGVLPLISAALAGEGVEVTYKSPWRHPAPKMYRGRVERVHLSDGAVYVLFWRADGRKLILNASFIKNLLILDAPVACAPSHETDEELGWLDGFGVWASAELHYVQVSIAPPAAEYYASQIWHTDQSDTWNEEVLVRSFPSMLSPELIRRLLSLGRYLVNVEPPALRTLLADEVKLLAQRL